jgi:hypothetical protein
MERTLAVIYPHPLLGHGRVRGSSEGTVGLWLTSPMMNHACDPNSYQILLGDVQVHRAARPIKKGEQIFHRYFAVTQADTVKYRQFECKCPLCLKRAGDKRNARRLEIYETLAGGWPDIPDSEVYEPLFAEFETLAPVAYEIGVLSELRADALEKAGRSAEARAARERANAAYEECGWSGERRFQVLWQLRHVSTPAAGREQDPEIANYAMRTWGISADTLYSIVDT